VTSGKSGYGTTRAAETTTRGARGGRACAASRTAGAIGLQANQLAKPRTALGAPCRRTVRADVAAPKVELDHDALAGRRWRWTRRFIHQRSTIGSSSAARGSPNTQRAPQWPSTSELVLEPGGYVGEHHHAGAGIRRVTSGYMTYVMPNMTHVYGPGDFFFEPGDVAHTAQNKTDAPMVHVLFEILPVELMGPSIMLPKRA